VEDTRDIGGSKMKQDLQDVYDADSSLRLKPHLAIANKPLEVKNDTPGLLLAELTATIEEILRYKNYGERK
jgi:hypothetical protein